MSKKLERIKEVSARTGYSPSTIYEKIKNGSFPKPISLGPKSVAWVSEEIDSYIDELIVASDSQNRARPASNFYPRKRRSKARKGVSNASA